MLPQAPKAGARVDKYGSDRVRLLALQRQIYSAVAIRQSLN